MAQDAFQLLDAGHPLLVAVVDDDGAPFAGRAWGVTRSGDAPRRLRVLLDADDVASFPGFRAGGPVAITGADPITLRSAQVKGRIVAVEPAGAEDVAVASRHRRATFAAIREADGTELVLLDRLVPPALAACTVDVEQCYDQTPGPGAGAAVETPA